MAPDLAFYLHNDPASIQEAVEYVMHRCGACADDPRKLRLNLRVGLTEALANAMLCGNCLDPSKRVKVEVAFQGSMITARITDEGGGFDPCCVPDPTLPTNLLKPDGRGIFLMRQLLDEVHFNDLGNSVTLVLRLSPSQGDGGPDRSATA